VTVHRRHDDNRPERIRQTPRIVNITLLGGFRVTLDGEPTVASWTRRSSSLVKVLALAPGHRLHREKVMDLLWPDEPLEVSAPRLHKAAHLARRVSGRNRAVVLRNDVVELFPGSEVTVDAIRFEDLARDAVAENDADAARLALEWYGGDLLPDDPYEDWVADRRELLHLRRLDLLRLAGEWRDLAALDPTNEEAHAALMRAHLDARDAAAVLREREHLERAFERELDLRLADAGAPQRVAALFDELAELVRREHEVLATLADLGTAAGTAGAVRAAT
jgi:DNA-binding SARP family transcriptional activator